MPPGETVEWGVAARPLTLIFVSDGIRSDFSLALVAPYVGGPS
jgi:hypothetical protein